MKVHGIENIGPVKNLIMIGKGMRIAARKLAAEIAPAEKSRMGDNNPVIGTVGGPVGRLEHGDIVIDRLGLIGGELTADRVVAHRQQQPRHIINAVAVITLNHSGNPGGIRIRIFRLRTRIIEAVF